MSLTGKAVHGLLWISLSTAFMKFLSFIINIILARMLEPVDFGLISIALLLTNFLDLFRDFGFGTALIYKEKDPDYKAANTAFVIFPILASILYIIIYIFSPYISNFFHEPQAESIIRILSLFLIITSFGAVQQILIIKELEFRKKFIPDIIPKIGYGISSIWLAYNGYGVWSLVGGWLVLGLINVITYWNMVKWRPSFSFDKIIALEMLGYGKHIIGANIIIFFITGVSIIFIGRMLDTAQLGFYSLAFSIANMFGIQFADVLNKVMFPVYSKLQNDLDSMNRAYLRTLKYVTFFAAPLVFGIISVSYDFILVVYGEKWLPAVGALQVLCLFGLCRTILATTENLFMASGKPEIRLKINLFQLILMSILMYPLTLYFGILGTSIAAAVPAAFLIIFSFKEAGKIIEMRTFAIAKTLHSTIISSIITALVLFVYRDLFIVPSTIYLASSLVIGICLYLGIVLYIDKSLLYEIREILNKNLLNY